MAVVTMKELLEAGVHFGHQNTRWDPRMAPFIYSSRNNIHVIDLHKTIPLIEKAYDFVKKTVADENATVLFVGTKKQAQEAVAEEAKRCGMFYVNDRWLGGTLTNFKTLKKNIARMKDIEKMEADGMFEKLPRKEVSNLKREYRKLVRGLGGIREMTQLPRIMFVIDTKKEQTAILEARRLNIPVIGIVDTNGNPEEIDFPVPANDDAIRSIKLITSIFADAVLAARQQTQPLDQAQEGIAEPVNEESVLEEAEMLSEEERLAALAPKIKEEEEEESERIGF
ncbi:MAG: 30S ribosomal protein S2 [Candidatus Margulisiibacteriota bacterium]|nr:30S ribosomal protein S2 [Candidatus Margulisiibacteriota bacterium]